MIETEIQASSRKAQDSAKRIEQNRACEPAINPLEALKESLTGGNHGVAPIIGAKTEYIPLTTRLLNAIKEGLQKGREEIQAENKSHSEQLTPGERKLIANEYRMMASELDR